MKKIALAASVFLTGVIAVNSSTLAADVVPTGEGGIFGYISGGYVLEDPIGDWAIFDPGYSQENLGDGPLIGGLLGYRWSNWDVAVGGQYADLGRGNLSEGPFPVDGDMSGEHFAIDGQVGFNTSLGSSDVRLFLGVRYAEWDNTVFPTSGAGPVFHNFDGVGPRGGFSASTPLSDSLSLESSASIGVLFGEIKTSAGPGWNCAGCTDTNTEAIDLEGELGVGFALGQSARAVLGWQAQWWDGVNVGITDATGSGLNVGKSGHLMTGPFVKIDF